MAQLKKLFADNTDVFALNDAELGCTDLVQHVIETGSNPQSTATILHSIHLAQKDWSND